MSEFCFVVMVIVFLVAPFVFARLCADQKCGLKEKAAFSHVRAHDEIN